MVSRRRAGWDGCVWAPCRAALHTPHTSLGLARTCREPFWRMLSDFCHQNSNKSQHNGQEALPAHLLPLTLLTAWGLDIITKSWNPRAGSATLTDNPAQSRAGFTSPVIDEPPKDNWWPCLGKTPWMIKWYSYFILNSKLIITCAVTHVTLPNLKNEGNEVENLFNSAKVETHRFWTETMKKASVLSPVLSTEPSKHLYSFMLTSSVNSHTLTTLQPFSRDKSLSCKSHDIVWLHQN